VPISLSHKCSNGGHGWPRGAIGQSGSVLPLQPSHSCRRRLPEKAISCNYGLRHRAWFRGTWDEDAIFNLGVMAGCEIFFGRKRSEVIFNLGVNQAGCEIFWLKSVLSFPSSRMQWVPQAQLFSFSRTFPFSVIVLYFELIFFVLCLFQIPGCLK
jgi:hypothetical protein